eukprot:3953942-Prymnesium_polylepis.1
MVAEHEVHIDVTRRSVLHMVHSTLSRAFWQWRSVAATLRGQLARVRRAVMFMSHTQAGRCWNAWAFE